MQEQNAIKTKWENLITKGLDDRVNLLLLVERHSFHPSRKGEIKFNY
jgi:hypothetical protein